MFTFENTKPTITDDDLLADLRRVADEGGASSVSQRQYRAAGAYSTTCIKRRFGTWNAATRAAGLENAGERDITERELFRNLQEVWIHLGRQPRKREMSTPESRFTHHPYARRFGGWLGAVRAFLDSVDREAVVEHEGDELHKERPRGPRDPSLRLRFLVLRRDRFACRNCGATPSKDPGVELHVDHVVPWAHGGPTAVGNLQALCQRCNLGKSDLSAEADRA